MIFGFPFSRRITYRQPEVEALGMDYDIDEVGIVSSSTGSIALFAQPLGALKAGGNLFRKITTDAGHSGTTYDERIGGRAGG